MEHLLRIMKIIHFFLLSRLINTTESVCERGQQKIFIEAENLGVGMNISLVLKGKPMDTCLGLCYDNLRCRGVSYNRQTSQCEFSESDATRSEMRAGSIHFSKHCLERSERLCRNAFRETIVFDLENLGITEIGGLELRACLEACAGTEMCEGVLRPTSSINTCGLKIAGVPGHFSGPYPGDTRRYYQFLCKQSWGEWLGWSECRRDGRRSRIRRCPKAGRCPGGDEEVEKCSLLPLRRSRQKQTRQLISEKTSNPLQDWLMGRLSRTASFPPPATTSSPAKNATIPVRIDSGKDGWNWERSTGGGTCSGSQEYVGFIKTVGTHWSDRWTREIKDMEDCHKMCWKEESCESYVAWNGGSLCQFYDSIPPQGSLLSKDDGAIHYQKVCISNLRKNKRETRCQLQFIRTPQHILIGFARATYSPMTVDHCLSACLNLDPYCASALYFHEERRCVLNSVSRSNFPDLFHPIGIDDFLIDYFEPACETAWNEWKEWSDCEGQERERKCDPPGTCKGPHKEQRNCVLPDPLRLPRI